MTITRTQRDEWRALADAATEGPWVAHYDLEDGNFPELSLRAGTALPDEDGYLPGSYSPTDAIYFQDMDDEDADEQRIADADFISAARSAVPALLDALDEAEAALEEAEKLSKYRMDQWDDAEVEVSELCAALDRVKALHSVYEVDGEKTCWHCNHPEEGMWGSVPHPCPTIQAIEGDQE